MTIAKFLSRMVALLKCAVRAGRGSVHVDIAPASGGQIEIHRAVAPLSWQHIGAGNAVPALTTARSITWFLVR